MKTLRCAIYTRKSSEEGLDQSFNSLHAQREACEAYVLSQAGEGWMALAGVYDDGGFSGGNMERPGLKRLLAAIKAKRVDVVVVYKVDRLTRSLSDFARIVETFDAQGVSFVSVTQAFNTTTSMGRLTLNVLLSFAQFEREVTGERIRDKVLASKQKGMWMGGQLPLGYDPPSDLTTRALVINPAEAAQVRAIFRRYLELRSVHVLAQQLKAESARTKIVVSKKGRTRGGVAFNRGALFHLLKNPTYIGMIPHKDNAYPGAHPPLIDRETFDAVQVLLAKNAAVVRRRRSPNLVFPLKGILLDANGGVMSPVTGQNEGRRYRYYVSSSVQRGQGVRRRPDPTRERRTAGGDDQPTGRSALPGRPPVPERRRRPGRCAMDQHRGVVEHRSDSRPRCGPDGVVAHLLGRLGPDERAWLEADGAILKLAIQARARLTGGRTTFTSATGQPVDQSARRDDRLIRALRSAHAMVTQGRIDPAVGPHPLTDYERHVIRLASLAPDLQRAILDGRQSAGLSLQKLRGLDLPIFWEKQRSLFAA